MGLPLHNHLHLREPGLDELPKGEAKLAQLCLKDTGYEVIGLNDQYTIEIGDELLEEGITIWESDLGPRLDQVSAALDE